MARRAPRRVRGSHAPRVSPVVAAEASGAIVMDERCVRARTLQLTDKWQKIFNIKQLWIQMEWHWKE